MIERRCNFCGDIVPDNENGTPVPFATVNHGHGGVFKVQILVTQDISRYSEPSPNPFWYFAQHPPRREDDPFDTCFGCAAHLVAVAYEQYIKKGASA